MAGTSLLTLLDDIATLLDDVAILSKTALKKTSGVLGDDLALNAEQVSGVKADRELPVVWAVAKGSFINKLILVPAALLISAFIPWLITPLLMIGGAYLCYEGAEKVLHRLLHKEHHDKHKEELKRAFEDPEVDLAAYEANKIKGAIRTDFILSAEIIVIALGTVQTAPFAKQSLVVTTIAFAITVFVYGLVAGIVKLDDAGLHLIKQQGDALFSRLKRRVGSLLLWFAPNLMRTLTFVGTLAMFLVGGGIIIHGFHFLTDWQDLLLSWLAEHTIAMAYLGWLWSALYTVVTGFVIGALLIPIFSLTSRFVLSQENKTD
jgi:predicted DNA repair protein MutK